MGKVIWRGWVTDPEEIAKANMVTPLGHRPIRRGFFICERIARCSGERAVSHHCGSDIGQ
jgi:hypothetical protein